MTYRIFAQLGKNTLGDFCHDALVAAAIAQQFYEPELTVYFRDNRPYKRDIVDCIPGIHGAFVAKENLLPIDAFGSDSGASEVYPWEHADKRIRKANLILAGDQFHLGMHSELPIPYMKIPDEWIGPAANKLESLGLKKSWFAVVYWKEPGYGHRGISDKRTITDPEPYYEAIRYIQSKGGQVVRIGHPGQPTNIPDVIDLAQVEGSHWLQMVAVSHARFMLASASGPCVYGPGFNTPTAITDQYEVSGVWRDHDYLVMRCLMGGKWLPHTGEDLCRVAHEMLETTKPEWREPTTPEKPYRPHKISFPLKIELPNHLQIAPTKRPPVMDPMQCMTPALSTIPLSASLSRYGF